MAAKSTKHKKLTHKETLLVKAKAKGLTNHKAYDEAGYSETDKITAVRNTTKVLSRPHVKEALDTALAKHGITLDSSIAPIGKGLVAIKMNEFTGEITEDIKLQLSASDRALKLMGIGQDKDTFSAKYVQIINEKGSKYND